LFGMMRSIRTGSPITLTANVWILPRLVKTIPNHMIAHSPHAHWFGSGHPTWDPANSCTWYIDNVCNSIIAFFFLKGEGQ
jgi:hypothetical protein